MMKRTNDEAARESLYGKTWMRFEAWDSGNCEFWLDDDGEVAAYVRLDDGDSDGIAFFEVRDSGNGIGSALIAELRNERPALYISGDIDTAACARFWHRNGFDVDGEELSNGKVWHAS
jgi:hypothetical protein